MARPRLTLEPRDWLDNKELRRCSPLARAVLIDMMCIASEGIPYGHVADKSGPVPIDMLSARFCLSSKRFIEAVAELEKHKRLMRSKETSSIYVPRMVRDEEIRRRRAEGGINSLSHPKVHKPKPSPSEEIKSAVVEVIVVAAASQTSLPAVEMFLPGDAPRRMQTPSGTFMTGFEAWWEMWSSTRGTNKHQQALQAWMSVLSDDLLPDCMACTESYLGSLNDPSRGYNPDNFLYDQKKQVFKARWPASRRNRDTGSEIAQLARERWDTEGKI